LKFTKHNLNNPGPTPILVEDTIDVILETHEFIKELTQRERHIQKHTNLFSRHLINCHNKIIEVHRTLYRHLQAHPSESLPLENFQNPDYVQNQKTTTAKLTKLVVDYKENTKTLSILEKLERELSEEDLALKDPTFNNYCPELPSTSTSTLTACSPMKIDEPDDIYPSYIDPKPKVEIETKPNIFKPQKTIRKRQKRKLKRQQKANR
jgi:hypothetical protein